MSLKIKWSAFIHTRTYSVDYRTLVVPDDFSEEKKKWVKGHIRDINGAIAQQSFNPPEELLQRLFLSDDQHYIFGVLCNLRQILTENDRNLLAEKYLTHAPEKAKDITVDDKPRRIAFAFLGYVIPRTSDIPELPPIRFDLEIFKPLCEYICHKWMEETQYPPMFLPYNIEESPEWLFDPSPKLDNLPTLNTNPRKLALHPGAESYTQQLWTAAAGCDKPQTLWIGQLPENRNPESILVSSFPEKRTLIESVFLNIALPNIEKNKIHSKQTEAIEIVHVTSEEQSPQDNNPLNCIVGEIEKLKNIPSFFNSKELQERMKNIETEVKELQKENKKKDDKIAELESKVSELKEILKNPEEISKQE